LCGPLNTNLFRLAAQFDPDSTVFYHGRDVKLAQFVARSGRKLIAEFTYSDMPRFPEARAIATFACDLFLKKEVDQVLVVGTQFVNTIPQVPICLEYLSGGRNQRDVASGMEPKEVKVEGWSSKTNPETIPLRRCLSRTLRLSWAICLTYVNIYIYQTLQNEKASEQSGPHGVDEERHRIMRRSDQGPDPRIQQARQNNITQELLEIAGGQAG